MTQLITLEVSDHLIARAREMAQTTNRRVEDVLSEWLERSGPDTPVELLSEADVLALADSQMDESQQEELSALLDRQRERQLDDKGRIRLEELMQVYRWGMLRKSEGLKVAVQRGLRPRLDAE